MVVSLRFRNTCRTHLYEEEHWQQVPIQFDSQPSGFLRVDLTVIEVPSDEVHCYVNPRAEINSSCGIIVLFVERWRGTLFFNMGRRHVGELFKNSTTQTFFYSCTSKLLYSFGPLGLCAFVGATVMKGSSKELTAIDADSPFQQFHTDVKPLISTR